MRLTPDSLSIAFAALADPTRRAILARLVSVDVSVGKLAEPFEGTLPAVTEAPGRAGTRGPDRTRPSGGAADCRRRR